MRERVCLGRRRAAISIAALKFVFKVVRETRETPLEELGQRGEGNEEKIHVNEFCAIHRSIILCVPRSIRTRLYPSTSERGKERTKRRRDEEKRGSLIERGRRKEEGGSGSRGGPRGRRGNRQGGSRRDRRR